MEHLSQDEIRALKELAQNLMAMGRVKKLLTMTLLWLSGIVTAGVVLWNVASHLGGKAP